MGADAFVRLAREASAIRKQRSSTESKEAPGCENGFDLLTSQKEMLAHIRAGAKDLSERTQFTPFCRTRAGQKSLLLFTRQEHTGEFGRAFLRETRRIWQFQVLGVKGDVALRLLNFADSVIFNLLTEHEAELPVELLHELQALPRMLDPANAPQLPPLPA